MPSSRKFSLRVQTYNVSLANKSLQRLCPTRKAHWSHVSVLLENLLKRLWANLFKRASSDSALTTSRSMADKDWRSNGSRSTEPAGQDSVNHSDVGKSISETSLKNTSILTPMGSFGKRLLVTAENAQSIYPPSACVFVAK